ncbi:hypothetical protein J3458_000634 [Metarhizium acridum]|uniref:uncharacterized protein n=1 Tax=Metarhizium acridum TaxID=92637 RepID=UPI001C6BA50D|nr:hypothetical protein J3458_000634 [Metarhizium acridum]
MLSVTEETSATMSGQTVGVWPRRYHVPWTGSWLAPVGQQGDISIAAELLAACGWIPMYIHPPYIPSYIQDGDLFISTKDKDMEGGPSELVEDLSRHCGAGGS